jgi:hypothetical protein
MFCFPCSQTCWRQIKWFYFESKQSYRRDCIRSVCSRSRHVSWNVILGGGRLSVIAWWEREEICDRSGFQSMSMSSALQGDCSEVAESPITDFHPSRSFVSPAADSQLEQTIKVDFTLQLNWGKPGKPKSHKLIISIILQLPASSSLFHFCLILQQTFNQKAQQTLSFLRNSWRVKARVLLFAVSSFVISDLSTIRRLGIHQTRGNKTNDYWQ